MRINKKLLSNNVIIFYMAYLVKFICCVRQRSTLSVYTSGKQGQIAASIYTSIGFTFGYQ